MVSSSTQLPLTHLKKAALSPNLASSLIHLFLYSVTLFSHLLCLSHFTDVLSILIKAHQVSSLSQFDGGN